MEKRTNFESTRLKLKNKLLWRSPKFILLLAKAFKDDAAKNELYNASVQLNKSIKEEHNKRYRDYIKHSEVLAYLISRRKRNKLKNRK